MSAQVNAQDRIRKSKRDFRNVVLFAYTDANKLSISQIPTDRQLDDKLAGTLLYGAARGFYIKRSLSVFEWCFDRNGDLLKNRESCGRPFVDNINRAIMIDGIALGGAARVPAGQHDLNNIWNIGVFQLAAWEQSLPIIDFGGAFPVCLSRWVGKKGDQNRKDRLPPNHQGSAAAAASDTNSVNPGIPVLTAAAAAAMPAQFVSQSAVGTTGLVNTNVLTSVNQLDVDGMAIGAVTGRQSGGNLLGVAPEAPAAFDPVLEGGNVGDDNSNNNGAQVDLRSLGFTFGNIAHDVDRGLDIVNAVSNYIMQLPDRNNGPEHSMDALTFSVDQLRRLTAELRGRLNNWQQ